MDTELLIIDDESEIIIEVDTDVEVLEVAAQGPRGPQGIPGPAGGATAGRMMIPIMAGSMQPSASGGSGVLTNIATSENMPDVQTLDFNQTTQQHAQFAIPLPKRWNRGTITARFRWSHAATTTNFGTVWAIQAVAVGDNEAINQAYGTAVEVTDTGGAADRLYVTSETAAFTVANTPADGDTVFFRVYRKAADAADTLAIVALSLIHI